MAFSWFKKKTRVVCFGDSITAAGVLPGGYITQLQRRLEQGGRRYELIASGISGNKVHDLYGRLDQDVLDLRPAVVILFVGVNDVWHQALFGTGTAMPTFQNLYTALIQKMQARCIRLILCTPLCIGEKPRQANALDAELDACAQVIRALATAHGCMLCDLRAAFLDYAGRHNPSDLEYGLLTTDGVHLNETGNALVAEMLEAALISRG